MSADRSAQFLKAMRALSDGDAVTAIRIGEQLLSSDDDEDHSSGYLCLAYAYEDGGKNLAQDFERSLTYFRRLSLIAPGQLPLLMLARVSMKIGGDEGFKKASKYLKEAEAYGLTPQCILGLAHYCRVGPQRDLVRAKKLYLRAAMTGRFSGFFGYSEAARDLNQSNRAFLMDCVRILAGPIIALLIGRRAQDSFID